MFSVYEINTFDPVVKVQDFRVDTLSVNALAIQSLNYINEETVNAYPATAKKANLIIKQGANDMPIVHPIWVEGLEVSVQSTIHRPSKYININFEDFISDDTVIAPLGTYTIVIVKKDVPFNERNTWTLSVEVTKDITFQELFVKFTNQFSNLKIGIEIISYRFPTIRYEITDGNDYIVYGADNFLGIKSTSEENTDTQLLYSDCKALIQKGIANKGINDTYVDGAALLYPTMFGSTKSKIFNDTDAVNLVCIRSKEPRMAGTHDEVVRQVIYLIVPANETVEVDLNGQGNTQTFKIGIAIAKVLTSNQLLNGLSHTTIGFKNNETI